MSKSQIRKLETILGKLENLESAVASEAIKERLRSGKRELLRALQDAEAAA